MWKRIKELIRPPLTAFKITIFILIGILLGLGLMIFRLSNAIAYMSDDPTACINCHVMTPQYATWLHSSHRERANCNDCHVPFDNIIRKLWFKANDGMRHAYMFTFRLEPQVIKVKDAGKTVLQENCIRCHSNQLGTSSIASITLKDSELGKGHLCWDCHREVPHGRVHSQASTPHAQVPKLNPVLPAWMNINQEK